MLRDLNLVPITWKLQLHKGRITKLPEDIVENVEIAPGTFQRDALESELASIVESKVFELQYQPNETTVVVSTSKRGEPPFLKRFDKPAVHWAVVEYKLKSLG